MASKVPDGSIVAYVDGDSGYPNVTRGGTYLMEGNITTDANGTEHHTQLVPTRRVERTEDGSFAVVDEEGSE